MSREAFESLVNGALDDIKDLPDFVRLPVGAFKLVGEKIGVEEMGKNKEGGLKMYFIVKETMELTDPEAQEPKIGDKVSFAYSGEFGLSKFKKVFLDVLTGMNVTSIAEFMDKFPDMEFDVAIKHRKDKNDETKVYAEIQSIVLG